MPVQQLLQGRRADYVSLIFFGIVFCLSFFLNYSREPDSYFADLRNRIVGARLLKQDSTVYFYKWNESQPLTLYDPYDKCNIRNNMITSPPSVLLLMRPIADLSYTTISKIWIALHYIFFLLIIIPLYFFFKRSSTKSLVLLAGCLLLLSDHWRDSVFKGQSHFIFPAILASVFWLAASQLRSRFFYIGLMIAFLVWIRPNALLLVPFIFLCKEVRSKQFVAGLGGGLLLFGIITLLAGDTAYWVEFYHTCREWISNNTSGLVMSGCNNMEVLEGKTIRFGPGYNRVLWQTEMTDIYHFAKAAFGISVKPIFLNILFLLAYLGALFFFYKRRLFQFSHALLAGILLYWLSEMTAPILKMSYYYVELFVVVLFFAGKFHELLLREKLLLGASFLFTFLHFIPMNLSIAEFCTIACLVSFVVRKRSTIPPVPGSHGIPARY